MPEPSTARTVHPVIDFRGNGITKDFTVKAVPPVEEQKEADPKAESARESAASSQSTPTAEQIESGTPAPTPASKESGEPSKPNEGSPTTENPEDEDSLPDSSQVTSPGKSAPPAPVLPPTGEKTQTQ